MTSSTTGDRRWGTTRRSGMTILGKVAVPKPINLPSQRLENQGLDPNVEIVPKGTLSWGSKSSLNAWGTSSVSPRTESGPGSPSHLSNRPSTGGSVTRPSTADSDKAHDSSSIAWDSNSRPSSASGVFPSNQASVGLQRPHSADTRPGSSHLSRFAEPVSETSATWGQHGDVPKKKDGFSLTSGDFPTLGAAKESSERSSMPQDAARPASSSGRSVEEREANVRIGDDNAWRRDNQPYSEGAPRHCREEGQLESHCPQSYPNANFPHQYDGWRGPPVNNHQGGGWYRGNPYGAPMGPRGFPVDPFPFYPPQVPPIPGHEAGPRGNHPANGQMFRPPILDSYVHPRMQTRPGFYLGPVPHESFYGPPMGYGSPGNRDLPFAGRPADPRAYSQHPGQGGYDKSGSSVAVEQNEPSHPPERQRQYKVLLRPQDGRHGDDEAKGEEFPGNRLPNAENIAQQMQTSQNNRRENRNETTDEVQLIKAEHAVPEDPSLIQKIEGLNSKTRSHDGWQNASSVVNSDQLESKTRTFNSGNSGNKVSARMPRTGHASDSTNSLHYKHGDPATNKNAELAAISGSSVSRRSSQQTQGRANHQPQQRVNNDGKDGWRKTNVMSGSSRATLAPNSENFADVNVGDSLDTGSIGKPVSGISVDPNDNQRATMRELARQRAQQRQKEEEERARDQRAKALAKLEELNRRSQVAEEGSAKNLEAASDSSIPDIPEVPRSLSPARMAAKSRESTEESGKPSMQNAMTSTEDADYVDPNQQDNLPRHRDGAGSKQKRLGNKQKQHIVFEKKMAGNTLSEATTEVLDVVPAPEVSNQGVISQNSDMPATSSVSTEQAFTKRKNNNRNGKKKHKVEETKLMNTTGAAVGKETKSGDESIEIGRVRAAEIKFGSLPVSSLDIKASGNSSDQISSSTNEESQSRAKTNSKSQHLRKTPRNSLVNKPADKFPGNSTVVWAPVHPQQKPDISTGVGSQSTVTESSSSSKSLHQGQTSSRSKRVELERYVAKPIAKEIAEQTVSKDPITAAPEMAENVLQNENCGGEGTGILQRPGLTAGKSGSPLKSRHGNGRQGKHGRGSAASTKALEDGQFGTSNQPIQGTVNHASNQSGQIAVDSSMDHVSHTAVTPNVNRGGQSGGRQYSRDRTYASQKRDVDGYEQQGFTPEQKMTSADTPDHSQNRSASQEVQGGHNPNSMFQKNTGQNRRFGRGQEPHGGWGSSMQENMHHHHQRPVSNRGRQKPNVHYEYKPVGSHAYDGEQLNDSSEGPRYREKGQGNQRHGGQKSYQPQRGSAGRNTGHGLSDERN